MYKKVNMNFYTNTNSYFVRHTFNKVISEIEYMTVDDWKWL